MYKFEVIYKFCLVLVMFFGLITLGFSAINFASGNYSEFWLVFHKFIGFFVVLAAILHVFNRKKKLIKLANEFLDVIFSRKNPSVCNMDRIISSLEPYTIAEISQNLGFDEDGFCQTLRKNGVRFVNSAQTLREVAKMNDEKIFFILVLIVEAKFGKRFCGELKFKRKGQLKELKMSA